MTLLFKGYMVSILLYLFYRGYLFRKVSFIFIFILYLYLSISLSLSLYESTSLLGFLSFDASSREGGFNPQNDYIYGGLTGNTLELYLFTFQSELATSETPSNLLKEAIFRKKSGTKPFYSSSFEKLYPLKNIKDAEKLLLENFGVYIPKSFLLNTSRPSIDIVMKYCKGVSVEDFLLESRKNLYSNFIYCLKGILNVFDPRLSEFFSGTGYIGTAFSLIKATYVFYSTFNYTLKNILLEEIVKCNAEVAIRCAFYWHSEVGLLEFSKEGEPGDYIGQGFHGLGGNTLPLKNQNTLNFSSHPKYSALSPYGLRLPDIFFSHFYYFENFSSNRYKRLYPSSIIWDKSFPNIDFSVYNKDSLDKYFNPSRPYIIYAVSTIEMLQKNNPGLSENNFKEVCLLYRLDMVNMLKRDEYLILKIYSDLQSPSFYLNNSSKFYYYDKFKIFYFDE